MKFHAPLFPGVDLTIASIRMQPQQGEQVYHLVLALFSGTWDCPGDDCPYGKHAGVGVELLVGTWQMRVFLAWGRMHR